MMKLEIVYYRNCVNFTIKSTYMYNTTRKYFESLLNQIINAQGLDQTILNVEHNHYLPNASIKQIDFNDKTTIILLQISSFRCRTVIISLKSLSILLNITN